MPRPHLIILDLITRTCYLYSVIKHKTTFLILCAPCTVLQLLTSTAGQAVTPHGARPKASGNSWQRDTKHETIYKRVSDILELDYIFKHRKCWN
jgi:hypothetical protein